MQKELHLSPEQAAEFYKEHEGKDYFDSLCTHMSRSVEAWRVDKNVHAG